jgi:hypothetical protein
MSVPPKSIMSVMTCCASAWRRGCNWGDDDLDRGVDVDGDWKTWERMEGRVVRSDFAPP